MSYYSYHGMIKKRIANGELVRYYKAIHPTIGECKILEFSTYPDTRPIQPKRYAEYDDILREWEKGRFICN